MRVIGYSWISVAFRDGDSLLFPKFRNHVVKWMHGLIPLETLINVVKL